MAFNCLNFLKVHPFQIFGFFQNVNPHPYTGASDQNERTALNSINYGEFMQLIKVRRCRLTTSG